MEIVPEIDVSEKQHKRMIEIRNQCFPDDQSHNSYAKQLPEMRALECIDNKIIAFMSLDYRVIRNENQIVKILGVVNLCVDGSYQSQGIGTSMLEKLTQYAEERDVDFIVLLSDHHKYYVDRGFTNVIGLNSWLRIHEHKNYGVAVEDVNDLYVKPINGKAWVQGPTDWLGYIY